MRITSLLQQTLGVGCLLLSGCDALQSARNDLARLTTTHTSAPPSRAVAASPAPTVAPKASTAPVARPANPSDLPPNPQTAGNATGGPAVNLVGKSESQIRDMLGPPSSEEDRAPGKVWRYRDGHCTVDVQFFPDVQTRQFGTLAYEVKSDDNSDEGKRTCMAQLRARAQASR